MLKSSIIAAATAAFVLAGFGISDADARSRSYGYHATKFRTGTCKRSSCFAKHPTGRYVYPLRR
ncbi:hypothetical protein [Methyloraptor flagellatus]|uniref:Uncharacterized protein n=1 Tax=Methyloraptor flagellatus TaxID=3162530 RepID=A0AAU7XE03_9HYPH